MQKEGSDYSPSSRHCCSRLGLAGAESIWIAPAAIAWPPRRAAHIIAAAPTVTGSVTATALTGDQLAPAARITRAAIGMSGVIALGAATLGVSRAWIPLLTWTLLATLWAPPSTATGQQVLTWMIQPPGTTPSTSTALILGATGIVAYAILGPVSELTHVAARLPTSACKHSIKTLIVDGDHFVAGTSSSSSARTLRSISSRMLRTWSIGLPPGSSSSQSRYRLPG